MFFVAGRRNEHQCEQLSQLFGVHAWVGTPEQLRTNSWGQLFYTRHRELPSGYTVRTMSGAPVDADRLERAYQTARDELLRRQAQSGCWPGHLSSSALATATAISAFSAAGGDGDADRALVDRAVAWLLPQQNHDGGWGDTIDSASNIATTMLAVAALRLAGKADAAHVALGRANSYIERRGGRAALTRRYGRDKTFAVPILMNCALAGMVDWDDIPPLPFELACLPQSWFRFARLPVVSYAIPALVAVGQAIHHHRTKFGLRGQLLKPLRDFAIAPSTNVLARMQPESGGYLEAMPLTSFVAMALASVGQAQHPVVRRSLQFLRDTIRGDGSWPIDTNLATWNTTLSIVALREDASEPADSRAPPSASLVTLLSICTAASVHGR